MAVFGSFAIMFFPRVKPRIRGGLAHLTPAAKVLLLVAITAMPLFGQVSYYGAIRGTIRDPSGALIPNANVTLTDENRNVARTTTSNSGGEYVFAEVLPSTYSLVVEVAGFKKLDRRGVIINAQDRITLDLALEVGAVTQSVEVTAAAPLIETANASQSQALSEQKLAELPNIGRNVWLTAKIAQNVVEYGNPIMNRFQDQSNTGYVSIAGGMRWTASYIIDGDPITDWSGRPMVIPTIEAVEEVKLMANTYDTEMGRSGGAMFNTVLKSGSNDIHGDLFGAIRRNGMDANNFFNNAAGIPLTPSPNDNWGGNIGGPLVIPHLYNGKNRTFWFFGYEGYNNGQGYSQAFYVPTALERKGDFTNTVTASGAPLILYDPLSTVQNPDGTYTRKTFLSETGKNAIPNLNPVGANIASYYAPPSTTPAYYGDPDVTATNPGFSIARQYVGKLDEEFTKWWRADISYIHCATQEPGQNYFSAPAASDSWVLWRKEDITGINNVLTLSPTSVLAVRYGFNRWPQIYYTYSEKSGFSPLTLGFPASLVDQMQQPLHFPAFSLTTVLAGDSLGNNSNNNYTDTTNSVSVMLSKTVGRHSFKAGFDFQRITDSGLDYSWTPGGYSFNGIFTQSSPVNPLPNTGADLADLLLGYPYSGQVERTAKLSDFTHYYAGYGQDDFRVNNRLTLNLGLRWEREYGFAEAQNRLYTGFNGTALNPEAAYVPASVIVPHGVPEWAGQGGYPTTTGSPEMNKLGPRIGFAFQINSKTVLRGGYGVVWGPVSSLNGTYAPAGFAAYTPYIATVNGYATPANSLSNPFPNGLLQPVGKAAGLFTGIGQGISVFCPWSKAPKIEQYSLDIQRDLPGGIAFSIGYVGTRGVHLPMDVNQNALDPTYFSMGASALSASVTNPFYGTPGGVGVIGSKTIPAYQLLLPYVTYSNVAFTSASLNTSVYNSMVARAQKRTGNGLTFISSLTWMKATDSWDGGNALMPGGAGPQNPFNLQAERGLSQFNAPLQWGLGFTYELPAGKGKPFLSSNKLADYVVGGWQLNGTAVYRMGFPSAMSDATNYNSPFGYAAQRPNATGISPETSGSLESRLSNYVNPAAFTAAPELTFGNVGRFIPMRGPGFEHWDLSLFKTVTIRERFKGQFRCEAFNAFNTPLFGGPNLTVGSGSFGHITNQIDVGRQIQLTLRFIW